MKAAPAEQMKRLDKRAIEERGILSFCLMERAAKYVAEEVLEVLEGRLSQTGIEYYKLEGATPPARRMEMVEKFNREDNPVQVFLISLKAGGTGLNLTAADVVIHFDPWWNKAVENQATDRVHRIGQKNVVNVYKLIAQNTIEENIVKLQERKRALAESILSGDAVGSGTFSRDDLMEILG